MCLDQLRRAVYGMKYGGAIYRVRLKNCLEMFACHCPLFGCPSKSAHDEQQFMPGLQCICEDIKHILFQCDSAREIWRRIGLLDLVEQVCLQ